MQTYVPERASDHTLRCSSASLHLPPAPAVSHTERSGDRMTHTRTNGQTKVERRQSTYVEGRNRMPQWQSPTLGGRAKQKGLAMPNNMLPCRATTTTRAIEERKRPRTAATPLNMKVRMAPPHDHHACAAGTVPNSGKEEEQPPATYIRGHCSRTDQNCQQNQCFELCGRTGARC